MREGWGSYTINLRPYMNGMPPYAVETGLHPVETGLKPVETGKNSVETGKTPVERGSAPCGNGSINWVFLFQLLTYPLPTCTILSQAAEKYYSKMFIRSKIMGNREDYEKKPEVITAIGNDPIKTPHHIPVVKFQLTYQ